MTGIIGRMDSWLFLLINTGFTSPLLDTCFIHITDPWFWLVPGVAATALFVYFKRKEALVVVLLMIITVAITDPVCYHALKPFFHRLRPCNPDAFVEGGRFLLGMKGTLSFPSNHAMNMFGQAMMLSLFYRRQAVWFFLFAAVIGISRIYVGVHYPLDILGGALAGVAVGASVYGVYRWIGGLVKRLAKKKSSVDCSATAAATKGTPETTEDGGRSAS
jgi:undecaprenyl-diphosphatase